MDAWLFGYCESSPDGTRPGRIQALGALRRGPGERWMLDSSIDLKQHLGTTRKVFWPQNPGVVQDLSGCIVRFHCEPTENFGETNTRKDWQKVRRHPTTGWDYQRFGYRFVDQGANGDWRKEPRWAKGFAEGDLAFVREYSSRIIVGPWRVAHKLNSPSHARELLPHPEPASVFQYTIGSLSSDTLFAGDVVMKGGPRRVEFMLDLPEHYLGEPVDLANQRQLSSWLVDQIGRHAPAFVAELDQRSPGWRRQLREELEGYDDLQRRIYLARWARLESILDQLNFEGAEIEKLLSHPRFLQRGEDLLRTRVAALAAERSSEIQKEAERLAAQRTPQLEREQADLVKRRDELALEVRQLEAEAEGRRGEIAKTQERVEQLIIHLNESRQRLLQDAFVFQPWTLPNGQPQRWNREEPDQHVRDRAGRAQRESGPPVTAPAAYVASRLWPLLNAWMPGTPQRLADLLHAAVCGARALLVPNPAWARAYTESLGGGARLTIITVEPTWLGFGDLWRGGLAECWERASVPSPGAPELVLLRDVNRALPQCYGRPLLDLLAGFAEELPTPGCGSWPSALRLLACTAPVDESLPLTPEVVRHFAAVQKAAATPARTPPAAVEAGHVPVATWLQWATRTASSPSPDLGAWSEFGPLARAAYADATHISAALRQLGLDPKNADRLARDVRAEDPAEYIEESPLQVARAK